MYDVNENTAPKILWNCAPEFLLFIFTIHSPLNIFIVHNLSTFHTKESAQWRKWNVFLASWGQNLERETSKSLKKQKKAFKRRFLYWRWNDYCENEKVILLSFIFIILCIFSLVSLACVRSETTNLQHVFCVGRGVLPYMGYRYVPR